MSGGRTDSHGAGQNWVVRTVVHFVVLSVAIGVAAWIVPGVDVHGGFGTLLWLAVLFALVNTIVGSVVRVLAFPLILLTFGLASFAVTVAMFALTAKLSDSLDLDGFWPAVGAALLVSILSSVLESMVSRALPGHR